MGKLIRVKFLTDKIERDYLSFSDNEEIKIKINHVMARLKENPSFGQPIPKRLIPKEYKRVGVENAFWVKLNRARAWRLIYTLTSDEIETTAIIVEWFTRHKDYERRFGY